MVEGTQAWALPQSSKAVSVQSTDPCIVKFAVTGVPYTLAVGLSSTIIPAISGQIPLLFNGIEDEHIYNVSLFDYEGSMGAIVELDPSTPNITAALSEVKKFVEAGDPIDVGGFTLNTIPNSYDSTCPHTTSTEATVYSTNDGTTMQQNVTDASTSITDHTGNTTTTKETENDANIGLPSTALMSIALVTAVALNK